jgi:hypothetical protein
MGESLNEETLERLIRKMSERLEYQSPYEHLYEWLKAKDPMLFKQWEAVYDITKGF